MPTGEKAPAQSRSSLDYVPATAQLPSPWREAFLLARYHLRLLNWWLVVLLALGFLGSAFLVWLPVRAGGAQGLGQATQLSRFVLEPGAGVLAAMLTSSLLVNDPLLEVTMATRAGIYRLVHRGGNKEVEWRANKREEEEPHARTAP